jgi:hypothetical protein
MLLSTLMAGCLGGDDLPEDTQDLQTEEGMGTVSGLILTIHLNPVSNANVRLVQDNDIIAEATTETDGRYRMTNIEPGEYRLQVSAACCRENVRAVTVVADEVASVDLQLELFSADDLQVARVEQYEWTGMLLCSVSTVVIGVSVCSAPDLILEDLGEDPATDDHFLTTFEVGRGLKSIVGAMEWRAPGAALGDELWVLMEAEDVLPNDPPRYVDVGGRSPLEFRVDAGFVESNYDEDLHQWDFNNIEETLELRYRIFASGNTNLVYQQQFTIYYDLYYWEAAPDQATALPEF